MVGWNNDDTPIYLEIDESELSDCVPDSNYGFIENEKDETGLYSVPTEVRGDVNYDGVVNNIDVMILRKYILHLIEW